MAKTLLGVILGIASLVTLEAMAHRRHTYRAFFGQCPVLNGVQR